MLLQYKTTGLDRFFNIGTVTDTSTEPEPTTEIPTATTDSNETKTTNFQIFLQISSIHLDWWGNYFTNHYHGMC